jgi:hypothetical protein
MDQTAPKELKPEYAGDGPANPPRESMSQVKSSVFYGPTPRIDDN